MQSGRSVGAVAPGGVAVRVESLVALLPVLLLFRSHDVCLHPRAQFRPEHVAHECRLTERRLVENAQVDRGSPFHVYRPPEPFATALFARTSTARAFHITVKQDLCNEKKPAQSREDHDEEPTCRIVTRGKCENPGQSCRISSSPRRGLELKRFNASRIVTI